MSNQTNLNEFLKESSNLSYWMSWGKLFLGVIIMAAGFVYFINPYQLSPGGVYGASVVLHNIFPSIQVGTFGYLFDIPLLIISAILMGVSFGARTVVAALTLPAVMNIMTRFSYPDEAAIEALSPDQLLGGMMNLSDHMILATLLGAIMAGIGSGLIIKGKATSGGTDLIAMLMQKYLRIPFSTAIFIADGCVVLFGLIVIGFGIGLDESVTTGAESKMYLTFYSLLAIYVTSRTVKLVLNGTKDDKMIFVVTEKKPEQLHEFILKDLDRTATVIKSKGIYTQNDKEILFLVVHNKEVLSITKKIKTVDSSAFVVVSDCYDAYGEGWKTLPDKDDVNPE